VHREILVRQGRSLEQLQARIVEHLLQLVGIGGKRHVGLARLQKLELRARVRDIAEDDLVEASRIAPVFGVALEDDLAGNVPLDESVGASADGIPLVQPVSQRVGLIGTLFGDSTVFLGDGAICHRERQ
jgi:hypothetical protein